ncbi:M61 family metallopeptidase [Glacieibacterium sp.]|uniref:M61 family metallopeptidase n=1 Tax=Glacieibacterium sp. TaxID=2860237 RepID=UPI003AFF9CE8
MKTSLRLLLPVVLLAAAPMPQPVPLPPAIPAPQDVVFPGTITLAVDATDIDRRIFRVRETIPVTGPGPMVLRYPEWIPGKHGPRGPIDKLAGLIFTAGGKRVEWVRDPVDVNAFHVDVPAGAKALDVSFQYLTPTTGNQGRIEITDDMLSLQWVSLALYPAGYFTRQIQVDASVTLPTGWKFGTALETARTSGTTTRFKSVPFDVLADAPMIAGRWFRSIPLSDSPSPVRLDIVADRPEQLEATEPQIAAHRSLVVQADRLFGSRHYDHYDFLLSLSDKLGGIGLEHHRSSENGSRPDYFTEWDKNVATRQLLPHEYTHSWNGKFRRGADAWIPDFAEPMRNSMLWVYEGQTQYWGTVLAARSGMQTREQVMQSLAETAALYDNRVGREWKPVQDTVNDPITTARRPQPWISWQRSEDYYSEGLLIWLDADTLIREKSGGKRSLDDFARGFFGIDNGSFTEATYDFAGVVAALNAVQPYDWATFLRSRLDGHGPGAPLDGFKRGGYRLVYDDKQSAWSKSADTQGKRTDLSYSIGATLDKDGILTAVQWEGPAFKAGLTVGTTVVAVAGEAYDADELKYAITGAKRDGKPIELLVKTADRFRTIKLDYRGGLRYPHLERAGGGSAALDTILTARN